MKAFTTKPNKFNSRSKQNEIKREQTKRKPNFSTLPLNKTKLPPKSSCACGGSCPRCTEHNSPKNLIQKQILRQTNQGNPDESREQENILIPTEEYIGEDLRIAKIWVTNASNSLEPYSRVIRLFAQDPNNLANRIPNVGTSRIRCAIKDNFNLDPIVNSPNYYASRILEITSRLGAIKRILDRTQRTHFRIEPERDSRCESNVAGFVANKSYPIYLCLDFFLLYGDSAPSRAAVIIHEVAHLAGMDDEQYIRSNNNILPNSGCFRRTRFTLSPSLTARNPDSYAYFSADFRP